MPVDVDPERPAPAAAPASPPNVDNAMTKADFLWEQRKYLLLLAALTATMAYSAGLNPQGGFWADNDGVAGVRLQVTSARRYNDATAFVVSLLIVVGDYVFLY